MPGAWVAYYCFDVKRRVKAAAAGHLEHVVVNIPRRRAPCEKGVLSLIETPFAGVPSTGNGEGGVVSTVKRRTPESEVLPTRSLAITRQRYVASFRGVTVWSEVSAAAIGLSISKGPVLMSPEVTLRKNTATSPVEEAHWKKGVLSFIRSSLPGRRRAVGPVVWCPP